MLNAADWTARLKELATEANVPGAALGIWPDGQEILAAYDHSTSEAGGRRGAVMLGDEMIDEASRKMALVVSAKGRAAGLERTRP